MICKPEKLLEYLCIEDTHEKIKTRIIVGNESKQRYFFLAHRGKLHFVGNGKCRHTFQVELFKPRREGDLDGFQSFRTPRMIILIVLHRDMIRIFCFQIKKQTVERTVVTFVLLTDISCPEHFHDHGKILFIFRCFILQIKNECGKQHGGGCIPKRILRLTAFRSCTFEQIRYQSLYIVIIF